MGSYTYTVQMASLTHYSLKATSLSGSSMGTMHRMYISKTGGAAASDCLGPASRLTSGQIFSMTSNTWTNYLGPRRASYLHLLSRGSRKRETFLSVYSEQ